MGESSDDIIVTDAGGQHHTWRPSLGPVCHGCGRPPGLGHTTEPPCPLGPLDDPRPIVRGRTHEHDSFHGPGDGCYDHR